MQWLAIGTKLIPLIVAAINGVEVLIKGHGKEKQDAAVVLVDVFLSTLETAEDRDLLKNEEVEKAIRSAIDAIVDVQNTIVAVKAAKP